MLYVALELYGSDTKYNQIFNMRLDFDKDRKTSSVALIFEGVKSMDVDHATSHLVKAIGLARFIRSIPFNAQRRIVLVPRQLSIKHQVSQENLVRNNATETIQELTYEIASQAHSPYEKAKSLQTKIPKPGRPVFLYGVPSLLYLKRLEKVNFDPYDPTLQRRDGLLPFRLFVKKLTRLLLTLGANLVDK